MSAFRPKSAGVEASRVDYYDSAGAVQPLRDVAALTARSVLTQSWRKLLLVMVGMPARGKSFIAHKLHAFLSWSGHATRVFNVGQHRRGEATEGRSANSEASFFDSSNATAKAKRETLAMEVLESVFEWFESGGGEIAVFDATNSTRARREAIASRVPPDVTMVFVESVCDDRAVIEANMRIKVAASPDFRGMDPERALSDLRERIANYEKVYEPVGDDEPCPYIKLFNFSSKVTTKLCFGRLAKTVVPYLMAVHSDDRPVYLTALAPTLAEPEFIAPHTDDDIGTKLAQWWWGTTRSSCSLSSSDRGHSRLQILASTLTPALDAALAIQRRRPDLVTLSHTSALNPLFLGELQRRSIVACLENDTDLGARSFHDRLDGGESYADLVSRLESCILDLEASVDPILIITHATPARALRAYFLGIDVARCMGATTSPETKALANREPAVLELRARVGGGWAERVHFL